MSKWKYKSLISGRPNSCFGRTAAPNANQIVSPCDAHQPLIYFFTVFCMQESEGLRLVFNSRTENVEQLLSVTDKTLALQWTLNCLFSLQKIVFFFCVLTWLMSVDTELLKTDNVWRSSQVATHSYCQFCPGCPCPRRFLKRLYDLFHAGLKIFDFRPCELREGILAGRCWSPEECPLGGERSCSTPERRGGGRDSAHCVMTAAVDVGSVVFCVFTALLPVVFSFSGLLALLLRIISCFPSKTLGLACSSLFVFFSSASSPPPHSPLHSLPRYLNHFRIWLLLTPHRHTITFHFMSSINKEFVSSHG